MKYEKFKSILNKNIFEESRKSLIEKISEYPQRYVSLFRPTQPKTKIIQNLLQSHEIKFGNAFEVLIAQYLKENNFILLEKNITPSGKKPLQLDHLFQKDNIIYFIEQKIRDDHDSTKKRGQIENFEKKVDAVINKYSSHTVKGLFYFIDSSFSKNKNFYQEEIKNISNNYGISLNLVYGKELFLKINQPDDWDQILEYLIKWRQTIPELPKINFDKNADESFNQIKQLSNTTFRKLFSSTDLDEILIILFPELKTLHLLKKYFDESYQINNKLKIYKTLSNLCAQTVNRLENNYK